MLSTSRGSTSPTAGVAGVPAGLSVTAFVRLRELRAWFYGELVAESLAVAGYSVSVVYSAMIEASARCRLSRSKTDCVDARVIARSVPPAAAGLVLLPREVRPSSPVRRLDALEGARRAHRLAAARATRARARPPRPRARRDAARGPAPAHPARARSGPAHVLPGTGTAPPRSSSRSLDRSRALVRCPSC